MIRYANRSSYVDFKQQRLVLNQDANYLLASVVVSDFERTKNYLFIVDLSDLNSVKALIISESNPYALLIKNNNYFMSAFVYETLTSNTSISISNCLSPELCLEYSFE